MNRHHPQAEKQDNTAAAAATATFVVTKAPRRCGKCGGGELFAIPATPAEHSHIVVGERLMRNISSSRYVCTDCGYVEEWVLDAEDLQILKQEYRHERDEPPGQRDGNAGSA